MFKNNKNNYIKLLFISFTCILALSVNLFSNIITESLYIFSNHNKYSLLFLYFSIFILFIFISIYFFNQINKIFYRNYFIQEFSSNNITENHLILGLSKLDSFTINWFNNELKKINNLEDLNSLNYSIPSKICKTCFNNINPNNNIITCNCITQNDTLNTLNTLNNLFNSLSAIIPFSLSSLPYIKKKITLLYTTNNNPNQINDDNDIINLIENLNSLFNNVFSNNTITFDKKEIKLGLDNQSFNDLSNELKNIIENNKNDDFVIDLTSFTKTYTLIASDLAQDNNFSRIYVNTNYTTKDNKTTIKDNELKVIYIKSNKNLLDTLWDSIRNKNY